jgi:hypothetical protein
MRKARGLMDTMTRVNGTMGADSGFGFAEFATLHDAYRRQIEHEDNLIGHRISWLVASESFLIAAFGLVITSHGSPAPRGASGAQIALLWVVPPVGIIMAALVNCSVGAAHGRLNSLREQFRIRILDLPPEYPSVTCGNAIRDRGRLPAKWVPRLLALAWCMTLAATLTSWALGK